MVSCNSKLLSISLIICFLLLSLNNILILNMDQVGYNFSLYDCLPLFVWILIGFCILSGSYIAVWCILCGNDFRKWWVTGIILICSANIIVILLPFLSGYIFPTSGDHLSHVGYAKVILDNGVIGSRDVYPIIHIFMTVMVLLINSSIFNVSYFISPFFYLLFIIFTYMFCRWLLPKDIASLCLLMSTVISCYYFSSIFPLGLSLLTLPLIFYLYFKRLDVKKVPYEVLLFIYIFYIVLFHPVSGFILLFIFLIVEFGNQLHTLSFYKVVNFSPRAISLIPSSVLFITLLLWIWNYYWVWESSVMSLISWTNGEMLSTSMVYKAQEGFQRINMNWFDIIKLFIKVYGQIFVYFALSVSFIILVATKKVHMSVEKFQHIYLYCFIFVLVSSVWIIDYVRPLTSLSGGRLISVVIPMFPLLVGASLFYYSLIIKKSLYKNVIIFNILSKINIKKYGVIFVVLMISFCSIIEISSFYPSPYIYSSNEAITFAGLSGPTWLLENGVSNIEISGAGIPNIHRISDAVYGTHQKYPNWNGTATNHFGYLENDSLLCESLFNKYLILRPHYLINFYTYLFPEVDRFNRGDLKKLDTDSLVCFIYTNSEVHVS